MRIPFVCLVLGMSAAANASVFVLDPDTLPAGTNVSGIIPGVRLAVETVPVMPIMRSTYAPAFASLKVLSCASTELCPSPGGRHKLGDAFYEGEAANDCFLYSFPHACSYAETRVLRMTFRSPSKNVTITTSWWSDDPVLFAYNRIGHLIAECHTHIVFGLVDDCVRTTTGNSLTGYRTVVSLTRFTPDIASLIVAGSYAGARIGKIKMTIP